MDYSFDKSLGHLSHVISKSLGTHLERKLLAENILLDAEQWSIISLLYHKLDLNQNAIAKAFGFDKVHVLRIINKLETEKLITRTTDTLDKRSRKVCLSEKGVNLYQKIAPLAQETIDNALETLSAKEVFLYMDLSKKIIKNLTIPQNELG